MEGSCFAVWTRRDVVRVAAGTGLSLGVLWSVVDALYGRQKPEARAASSPEVRVAWIAQQQAAESNQRTLAGFQQWLKAKGYPWQVTVSDAKGDPGTLSNMVTDAATRRVDAIIVGFGTLTAAQGALAAVAKSGVPFFSVDSGWFPPSIADITSNNYVMGGKTSAYMIQRLLGEGKREAKIGAIIANFHHGTRKRGKVLETVLSENQNVKLVAQRVIQYTGFYETTLNAVGDWLSKYGRLDAIWCPWDEPAMAAAQAIMSKGMGVSDMFVVGADGHPPTVDQMRDNPRYPVVATVAQAFELWGALAGYFVEQIVVRKRPAREVVPVPIVELPTPLIVKGVNLPPKGKQPWEGTDLYTLFEQRAAGSVK